MLSRQTGKEVQVEGTAWQRLRGKKECVSAGWSTGQAAAEGQGPEELGLILRTVGAQGLEQAKVKVRFNFRLIMLAAE